MHFTKPEKPETVHFVMTEEEWNMCNLRWSHQSLLDETLNRQAVNRVLSHCSAHQLVDTSLKEKEEQPLELKLKMEDAQ